MFSFLLISVFVTATNQASLNARHSELEKRVDIVHDQIINRTSRKIIRNTREILRKPKQKAVSFNSRRTAIPAMFFVRSREDFADRISNDVGSISQFLTSRRRNRRVFYEPMRNGLDFTKFLKAGEYSRWFEEKVALGVWIVVKSSCQWFLSIVIVNHCY